MRFDSPVKRSGGNGSSPRRSLMLSRQASRTNRLALLAGQAFLFLITSLSAIAVLFIFIFIARDAIPFFKLRGFVEFFTSPRWYPTATPPEFGVLSMFVGTGLVTVGAIALALPLGVAAAVCLSDVLPFKARQYVKPVIEILAAIPSVAYGFFALVVFAPLLQQKGGPVLSVAFWVITIPLALLFVLILSDLSSSRLEGGLKSAVRLAAGVAGVAVCSWVLYHTGMSIRAMQISSGANALN
ncbi:MAG: phosphate ABC transporter permease, partial [Lentisphaerota bacterium]